MEQENRRRYAEIGRIFTQDIEQGNVKFHYASYSYHDWTSGWRRDMGLMYRPAKHNNIDNREEKETSVFIICSFVKSSALTELFPIEVISSKSEDDVKSYVHSLVEKMRQADREYLEKREYQVNFSENKK